MVRLRRLWIDYEVACEQLFQSHYGAIATPQLAVSPTTYVVTFNPTMVRLRPVFVEHNRWNTTTFQSHYGAIATSENRVFSPPSAAFNPTMVRLRPSVTAALTRH